jgi:Methylase involved in ubiquinone/menaquinone biosynthesis
MNLTEIANKYSTDKGTIKKHDWEGDRHFYSPIYDQYLSHLRNESITILEIGIGSGPSLKMWYEYMPNARIFALDIDDKTMYNNDRVKCYKGDQSNREHLERLMSVIGQVDVIIDDGGHYMNQQQISFASLFKYLKPDGMYFIEDLHTSYWPHGKVIYNGVPVDINEDRSNTTVK